MTNPFADLSLAPIASHQLLLLLAGAVCLFGTWVGMRHFARARATAGLIRTGWLFMASVGTGAALWAATFISILALDPQMTSAFALAPTAGVLAIAIVSCLAGFEIGSRPRPALAPEIGGLVMGAGILAMHWLGLQAWHVSGDVTWNWYGIAGVLVMALGLSALSVNRANRPVTRWCRHGAAIVMTFMICVMHYTMSGSMTLVPTAPVALAPGLIPAGTLAIGLVCAIALVIGSGFASYVIDLRTRTESADRIHQLSFNDAMTGLPNRIAFNERLAFATSAAHELAHKVAVFAIDIDGFKDINDLYGHAGGDALLVAAAGRMRGVLGDGEFLARQGGDEFVALQVSGAHPRAAQALAARLAAAVAVPFEIAGKEVALTASIGVSLFPTDTAQRDLLLSNAKMAMQRGKEAGAGRVTLFDSSMDDAARQRRALARDLTGAAARGELELHYQLQTDLADGGICGAEALMRWRHPKHGLIPPAEFIPLAEDRGAIGAIGEWALRTACRDAAAGLIPGTVAVNLSPLQLRDAGIVDVIRAALADSRLAPQRLEVEVTESAVMADTAGAQALLHAIKVLGVGIAMDDFGTGYSSLATLHAFPFDKLKLDQSFVRRLPDDRAAAAIVGTVMALGRSLNMPVLAEGIETPEQWAFLRREGCAKGQGYLFAKPVPVERMPAALMAAADVVRAQRAARATPAAA